MLDVLIIVVVACLMLLYVMIICVWTDIPKMKPEILVFNVLLVAKLALLHVLKVAKLVGMHLLLLLVIVLVLAPPLLERRAVEVSGTLLGATGMSNLSLYFDCLLV